MCVPIRHSALPHAESLLKYNFQTWNFSVLDIVYVCMGGRACVCNVKRLLNAFSSITLFRCPTLLSVRALSYGTYHRRIYLFSRKIPKNKNVVQDETKTADFFFLKQVFDSLCGLFHPVHAAAVVLAIRVYVCVRSIIEFLHEHFILQSFRWKSHWFFVYDHMQGRDGGDGRRQGTCHCVCTVVLDLE